MDTNELELLFISLCELNQLDIIILMEKLAFVKA